MIHELLAQEITRRLGFTPTTQQAEAIEALARFLVSPAPDAAFVLRGYAGTGKTSLVAALVRTLRELERPTVLLAPTGRAAKVLSAYAGEAAYTIHKMIYRQKTFEGESTAFSLGYNKLVRALFVVDEASMIANAPLGATPFGTGQLLDDLVRYVGEGESCKLLLVGDTAQLPPVGEVESPALRRDVLAGYGLRVSGYDLTAVVRQAETSGVLWNATRLRHLLQGGPPEAWPKLRLRGFDDVTALPPDELIETLDSSYRHCGTDETIVVTRSNKRAVAYNNGIRSRIFGHEGELVRGDVVMAVKNNYFWAEAAARGLEKGEKMPFDFIANGDTAVVRRIRNVHEMHGFRFADATLSFPDYDDFELDCCVLLDTLQAEAPALTRPQAEQLFARIEADYADIRQKRQRYKAIRADKYYNALQIKYAYAITCHKAQGGQWSRVFVDQGWPGEAPDSAYVRWLYTALTRTTDRLYLVGWPAQQITDGDS